MYHDDSVCVPCSLVSTFCQSPYEGSTSFCNSPFDGAGLRAGLFLASGRWISLVVILETGWGSAWIMETVLSSLWCSWILKISYQQHLVFPWNLHPRTVGKDSVHFYEELLFKLDRRPGRLANLGQHKVLHGPTVHIHSWYSSERHLDPSNGTWHGQIGLNTWAWTAMRAMVVSGFLKVMSSQVHRGRPWVLQKDGEGNGEKYECKLQVWSCPMSWVCCLLFTFLKEDNKTCWTSLQIINFDISVEVDLNIGSTAVPLQGVSRLRVAKLSRCLGNVTGGWWYVWHPVIQPSSSYPAIEWCRKRFKKHTDKYVVDFIFSGGWCWCRWWEGWGWCGLFDMSDDVIYLRDST